MGARTIDEGAMDEKIGHELLGIHGVCSPATPTCWTRRNWRKRIASLEGERKSFNKGKRDSEFKLESKDGELRNNTAVIEAMTEDWNRFLSVVQTDKEGNRLNPIKGGRSGLRRREGHRKAFAGDSQERHDGRAVHADRELYGFPDQRW